jgi:hypothetical protein
VEITHPPPKKRKKCYKKFLYDGREGEGGYIQRENTKGRVCAVITDKYSQVKN